jgi:hypothetical protein
LISWQRAGYRISFGRFGDERWAMADSGTGV